MEKATRLDVKGRFHLFVNLEIRHGQNKIAHVVDNSLPFLAPGKVITLSKL